ncbi:hypothetical protein VNO78_13042 [Psophocarpus tetragonolobus]|uniref:AIPP2-like SPOC-like domain-containing protein n=1 Tax=Psophocarpus tetragonolobus TaxID=3891 RepID=A0AAN9SQP9_PSOTE
MEGHKDWICQECMPREGTNKLVQDDIEVANKIKNDYLSESSKPKSRSPCVGKPVEYGVELSTKRQRAMVRTSKLKSVNEIVYSIPERSSAETLFSGPKFCNNDVVESCGCLDHELQTSNQSSCKDLSGKKKNESQVEEQPTKVVTSMSMGKLFSDVASNERTHSKELAKVKGIFLSQDAVIPENHHEWLGKFQMQNSEGIIRTFDGIQAHISTCASTKVFEVTSRLPKIIMLEELPRLKIWPNQLVGRQIIEQNIALYFFAHDSNSYRHYEQLVNFMITNDLGLKGNVDGIELLIFPSNILPENSQCWNNMFFLWGVFKGKKVNKSISTPMSNSLKVENGNVAKNLPFDLNAYPKDEDDMAIIDEISKFESSTDTNLLVGENSDDKIGDANANCKNIDINVSVWLESETSKDDSIGIKDNNVEAPSASLSPGSPSTTFSSKDWTMVHLLIYMKNHIHLCVKPRFAE